MRGSATGPVPGPPLGSAAIEAVIARTAPAVLALLADGAPRSKAAIVAALAGRHGKADVVHTLMRLSVTGRLAESGGRYTPGPEAGRAAGPEADP